MARDLRVSINTVNNAYYQLEMNMIERMVAHFVTAFKYYAVNIRMLTHINMPRRIQLQQCRIPPVERLTARGEDWVREFVAAALKKVSLAEHVPPLLDPLIDTFELPLPDDPRYWLGWMRTRSAPTHHCRWEKRFIAACAAPNAFVVPHGDRTTYLDQVVRRAQNLRAAEPTDDLALLRALLQVFDRGDRISGQRIAML